jgi:hypothetical protein
MPLGFHKAALFGVAGVSTGDVVLLSSQTADGDASISFTSGITSTYGEYIFKFYNINPGTDAAELQFNASTDGGSNYGIEKTTTYFRAYHYEDDNAYDPSASLQYDGGSDLAEGTGAKILVNNIGNGADESAAGEFHFFNPSSTTYVKHFYSEITNMINWPGNDHVFTGGYVNTTTAINAVKFDVNTGVFDGTIKMWGVK